MKPMATDPAAQELQTLLAEVLAQAVKTEQTLRAELARRGISVPPSPELTALRAEFAHHQKEAK